MTYPDTLSAPHEQHGLLFNRDLIENARCMGPYRLACEEGSDKPVLEGALSTRLMQPGLSLHTMDARIVQPFRFETQLEPCLKIALVLSGHTRVNYGDRLLNLGPDGNPGVKGREAVASVITLNRRESCVLQDPQCGFRRSLTLTLSPQWLEQQLDSPSAGRLLTEHLRVFEWQLPAPILRMADQLSHHLDDDPAGRLMREGFALTLAGTLLQQLEPTQNSRPRLPGEGRRERQLQALLHSGEADYLTLAEIGDRLGMSVATLQRHSRKILGTSLNAYLRERRLAKAYQALARGDLSVAESAALAGYSHPANFATAFRQRYGITPGALARGKRREP